MGADKPRPGAQPLQVDADMVAALRSAGATEAQIAEVIAERGQAPEPASEEDEAFAIDPDNWESWQVFEAVDTQWNWVAVGLGDLVRMGLNHPAAESGMRMLGVPRKRQRQVYEDLRLIERAVLVAENEMRAARPRGKRA